MEAFAMQSESVRQLEPKTISHAARPVQNLRILGRVESAAGRRAAHRVHLKICISQHTPDLATLFQRLS